MDLANLVRDKKFILGAVAVAVIVVIIILAARGPQSGRQTGAAGTSVTAAPQTRQVAPTNLVVPGQNTKNAPANVAVPSSVTAGDSSGKTSQRTFNIKAYAGQFTPNTIIVKTGDNIDIYMTAVDHDYDFTQPDYGWREPLPKGQTKRIIFQATASGKFTYYCQSCGGIKSGAVGYIIAE